MWPMLPTCLAIVVAPGHVVHSTVPATPPHCRGPDGVRRGGGVPDAPLPRAPTSESCAGRSAHPSSRMMSAVYGFMMGAWPLGIGLIVYSVHVLVPLIRRDALPNEQVRDAARLLGIGAGQQPLDRGIENEPNV